MRQALGLFAIVIFAACGGDGGPGPDEDAAPARLTYYQDVKPILDAKCTQCHAAGGIGPFALGAYADITDREVAIRDAVDTGLMPPWPPNADCNEYYGERSLTDAHRQMIIDWIDQGALEGDAANPAPPIDVEQIRLTRVDSTLEMTEPYTTIATAAAPDDYRCFVIPWPETTAKYITGFRATPGDARIVHHVIAFHAQPSQVATYQSLDAAEAGPGYTCFGGSGGPSRTILGTWVPGTQGSDFPPGTGLRIDAGSAIILQVHYNVVTTAAAPDATSLEFKLDDNVTRVAQTLPWGNPSWLSNPASMHIPAGEADTMHQFAFDPTLFLGLSSFDIHASALHMHQLGTRATLEVVRQNGDRACLLQIDDWNFHWQGSYGLRTPVRFNAGDQLRVECHWDNSPENQPYINGEQQPPQDVQWGEGTRDEMCVGGIYLVPP